MTDLRCLSLDQPWASLIAIGVKTIETRSWPTKHRGRIGIASTKRRMVHIQHLPPEAHHRYPMSLMKPDERQFRCGGSYWPDPSKHPLGAIVATANLVDVLPMVRSEVADRDQRALHIVGRDRIFIAETVGLSVPTDRCQDVTDQLPYGDFTPGRWAWLLDDVKATTKRCPACWGDGDDHTLRIHSDWHPDNDSYTCEVCKGAGVCDPIPVKGKQRLWRWTV